MPHSIRLWSIVAGDQLRELSQGRLDLESRLEAWLAADISLLDDDLLVIGRQVPTAFGGIIDLVCLDGSGDVAIVEMKRDRTPREVVAQALDYASWVAELGHEDITELAAKHFDRSETLEEAFQKVFGADLPDTLNQDHRILIVASAIDASSERIISYLSSNHGVSINAATFQYFQDASGKELLARVFLLEPQRVEHASKIKGRSKRRRRLTDEDLEELADERGVGPLYRELVDMFRPHFDKTRRTGSSIGFIGDYQDKKSSVMLSLIPGESDQDSGVRFQLYSKRIAYRFGMLEDELADLLPASRSGWRFSAEASDDQAGYQGYFDTSEDASRLIARWNQGGSGPIAPAADDAQLNRAQTDPEP